VPLLIAPIKMMLVVGLRRTDSSRMVSTYSVSRFFAGENHGKHEDPIFVEFLLATPGDHDSVKAMIDAHNGPVFVRRVETDMPIAQFFGFFKRFSVSLSSHGMLDGRDYTYVE
jgi:hypothetical protein